MKLTSILIILLFAFTLAACGGGGSSGPAATDGMDPDGMDDDMAMMCPEGHTGTYPNCVDPAAEAAADKAEAERIAAAIGPGERNVADLESTDGIQMPFTADGKMLTTLPDNEDMDDDFAKSDTASAGISGLTGAMYERTTPDNEATPNVNEQIIDSVVTYTDQAEKTDADYSDYMGTGVDINHDGNPTSITGVTLETDTNDADLGVLSLDTGSLDLKRVSADFGLTAPNQSGLAIPPDEKDGTESTIEGMFHGVQGTFTCDGSSTSCTASSDKEGNLMALAGAWTFKPDALDGLRGAALEKAYENLKVPGVVEDPDYMTFGYWLRQTEGKDGTEYAMSSFAHGKRELSDVSAFKGTATYEGSATGLYMKKSLTSEGDPTGPFESGQFTADVMLQANFDGDDVAVSKQHTITGSVTDFRNSGGNIINDNWSLSLKGEGADAPGTIDEGAGTFTGKTVADKLAGSNGDFSGSFNGDAYDADDNPQPGYATGIFDGHFTNGHVRGAFGATKE